MPVQVCYIMFYWPSSAWFIPLLICIRLSIYSAINAAEGVDEVREGDEAVEGV